MLSDLPSILHHDSEVLVGVNTSRHISEIVAELFEGDDAVSDLSVPQRHELHVDFLGVLAGDHVRVLANIIDPRNIVELDGAIAVHVQLVVSLPDEGDTRLVQITLKNK